jgi:hypothetical protein
MPFDLSLPLFAASGLAIGAAVTYFGIPHLRMRTYNKTYGALRVIEIAFMLSGPGRTRRAAQASAVAGPEGQPSGTEFVIYLTLKTCNH